MSHKPKPSVRARGVCPDGHVTEVTTDPGRTTWEGPCGRDGCELRIKARRVPAATPAATADPDEVEVSDADGADPYQVIEVEGYDNTGREQPAAEQPSGGADPAGDDGAGGGGDAPPAAPAASGAAEVRPAGGTDPGQLTGDRGGFGFRGRRQRPDRPPADDHDDEVIPGLF